MQRPLGSCDPRARTPMDHEAQIGPHTLLFEPPRLIHFVVRGEVTAQHAVEMGAFVKARTADQRFVLALADLSAFSGVSSEARKAAGREVGETPYAGMALVGARFEARILTKLVLGAVRIFAPGKALPAAFFDTEAEARAWLAERERQLLAGEGHPG